MIGHCLVGQRAVRLPGPTLQSRQRMSRRGCAGPQFAGEIVGGSQQVCVPVSGAVYMARACGRRPVSSCCLLSVKKKTAKSTTSNPSAFHLCSCVPGVIPEFMSSHHASSKSQL